MSQNERITRIHLLGMPGCGKDTNAIFLRKMHPEITNIISTGDIFRGANTPDGEYGEYYPML
jgi:adenylate kinase family enzyme